MMRAMYSSVAGLRTHQMKMDVIGNNISNVNTVGFKSSRVTFSTMMYETMAGASGASDELGTGGMNAKQIGLGASFAATAVDIETGGASETTGRAFDLKIADKNTTSFFIVNTGTENVFTRAGAFTVDGSGTLCMESTGYKVMGWQVDANGNINKDTVSPLRIMSADNQTSQPEFTTQGRCTGILDDTSATVNTDTGYNMSLNFFDNLGYAYTGRFAVQKTGDKGQYTINLTDVLDSTGASMVSKYGQRLGNLFGSGSQGSHVDVTNNYTVANGMSNALKKLALTAPAAGEDGSERGPLVFHFPSEVVNQYLGSNSMQLPEGLTIRYSVPVDDEGNVPTLAEGETELGETTVRIYDNSGTDVTNTYASQARYQPLFNASYEPSEDGSTEPVEPEESYLNLYKRVTALDKIEGWYDRNQLEKDTTFSSTTDADETDTSTYYRLNTSQIDELKSTFPDEWGAISGTDILVQVGEGDTLAVFNKTENAVNEELAAATHTYSLIDYMNYAYLNVDAAEANEAGIFTTQLPEDLEIRLTYGDNSVKIVTPSTDGYTLSFSTQDGTLNYIGQDGNTSQLLRLSLMATEDNPFTDIRIDFSALKNLANGGTSTAGLSSGTTGGEGAGKKVGNMIGLSVDSTGKVFASYSNGNTTLVGQIPVARFANAAGLESIGENCFRTTMNSGEFDGIGVEIDSDGSVMSAGTLEMSNVDLAVEFTQMITTQRGYQANSRIISTSSSILEELVNLLR